MGRDGAVETRANRWAVWTADGIGLKPRPVGEFGDLLFAPSRVISTPWTEGPRTMSQASNPDESIPDAESLRLIQRAQGGDRGAYEQLFERYYPRVQRLVRRQLGSRMRADLDSGDVVNEAMVQAIRAFEGLEAPSRPALVSWFAAIVRNRIRDLHKRRTAVKRDHAQDAIVDHISAAVSAGRLRFEAVDEAPLPEDRIALEEDLGRLRGAVAGLSDLEQDLISLRSDQQLEWREIASRLGLGSPDAARMAFSRAKVALARALREGRPGEVRPGAGEATGRGTRGGEA